MADRIRVGIVGATVTPGGSGWGANAHVPALQALPNFELKAVCTAHAETARASAEKFGADLAFDDIDQMAAHLGVNPSTIVRFCYRLGLNGFPDLQERMRQVVRGQLSRADEQVE